MAGQDSAAKALLEELWTLVESWSDAAIEGARTTADAPDPAVAEAQIRSLMDHALELRSVLDRHDVAADPEPEPEAFEPPPPVITTVPLRSGPPALSVVPPAADEPAADKRAGDEVFENPLAETAPAPAPTVREHRCNSADFERPPCKECGVRHWYCSICGARRDECVAELLT